MPSLSFVTVDVFTTSRFAGNPLAIVRIPEDGQVSTEQMQIIAREFNLSETVFLHENRRGDDGETEWGFRIFMTSAELPFAGHPTIGTACYALGTLADNARSGKLLCSAGPIGIQYSEGVAKASIPHNVHIHTESRFTTEQLYDLQPALASSQKRPHAMTVVSPVKGMNFIMVELDSLEDLAKVTTSGVKPRAKLDKGWDTGFVGSYFYVVMQVGQQPDSKGHQIRTRMIEGPLEDAATGSAACGLCAYLAMEGRLKDVSFLITQGVEMGRKSEIGVAVTLTEDFGAIDKIELSGSAVKVMEGMVHYD
ncbi:hypothetical protein LTR35_009201 [Friedmanniomyces endolithicus]|uniref:Diaminopimelate epimerase-like protein n=1 Tax=Friedmanniomyces endolithicus TaxID=329885 RepID=A0AAN6J8F0_9PEZI|nr:hypothetical protein LTR35_009201 [Friedmanniomyces endolithicus]KAK0292261.1 hypothetical protein LTS00_008096 [Friedmanniomyces endolithicus]KAK0320255.1 hypothetical protein LTR82_008772 [Friedmanniomyces endolithicus]KAK0986357.1 hypothetical protein LTR54_013528 [Friedmanniomyces endolithicus]